MTKDKYREVQHLRFLPVKQTSDLLLVMSNLYSLDHGALIMSPMVAAIIIIMIMSFMAIFSSILVQGS